MISSIGCTSDSSSSSSTSSSINSNGLVINSASDALASIQTVATASALGLKDPSVIRPMTGVANTYCTATGGPKKTGGATMSDSDSGIASAYGFCQATFNSQSPDTARGALYIAGGMACEAAVAGLFDNLATGGSNTTTKNLTISTTCWGSTADVNAFISENGSATISNVALTVTEVSGSTAYNYKVTFVLSSETVNLYLYNAGGVIAALNASDGWAVKFDKNNGIITYENTDSTNNRRVRMKVVGTVNSSGVFSAVSSVQGFQLENTKLYTFTGNVSTGIKGNFYDTCGSDRTDECYLPPGLGTATCSGVTAIASSDANATALKSNIATAKTNLKAMTSSLLSVTTIDPSDTDITQ